MGSYGKRSRRDPSPFDSDYFSYWKVRISAFLNSMPEDVLNSVVSGYVYPTKPTHFSHGFKTST